MRRSFYGLGLVAISGCASLLSVDDDVTPDPSTDAGSSSGSAPSSSGAATSSGQASSGAAASSSSSSSGGQTSTSSSSGDVEPDAAGPIRFVSVAAGVQNGCGVLSDTTLACWGGALGAGPQLDADHPELVQRVYDAVNGAPLSNVAAAAVGNATTCAALRSPDRVLCWGNNGYGRLGDGTTSQRLAPVEVVGPGLSAVADWAPAAGSVAVGSEHACALRIGGTVACWGRTAYGALGRNDDDATRAYADAVVDTNGAGSLGGITQLALGNGFSCGLKDGSVYCWGNRFSGTLGDGMISGEHFAPAPVLTAAGVTLAGVTQITAGGSHACALVTGGAVYCWGSNSHLELGVFPNGASPSKLAYATIVQSAPNGDALTGIASVGAGTNHTCAITAAGESLCWGANNFSQLGIGAPSSTNVATPSPTVTVVDPIARVTGLAAVVAGSYHSMALAADGTAWTWGDRALGRTDDHSDVALAVPFDALGAP